MLMIVVSVMTYTVSSGMLNSTIPYFVCSIVYLWVYFNFFAVCCFDFRFFVVIVTGFVVWFYAACLLFLYFACSNYICRF